MLNPEKINKAYLEFSRDLNKAFPELKVRQMENPRIFKSDSMSRPSLESYHQLEQSRPNKPRVREDYHNGSGISLHTILSVMFTAPDDKTRLDSWLRKYLAKLSVMEKIATEKRETMPPVKSMEIEL